MPRGSEAGRIRRHRVLLDLLGRGVAGTQDDIVRQLRREGFRVTQATVSRDLDDLGAVRRRAGERHVYVLPEHNGPPSGWGVKLLPELVIDAVASGNLVVVRTFPGMASTVGAILDDAVVPGIIGTVAGDDTVLVVAAENTTGRAVARRVKDLASPGHAAAKAGGAR